MTTAKAERHARRKLAFHTARERTYAQMQVAATLTGDWSRTGLNKLFHSLMKANGYTLSYKASISMVHYERWLKVLIPELNQSGERK